jgi:ATP-dependent helicase/nuclease subunit B
LIINPSQSLIDEIIPHLNRTGKDYSSNLIVFPGKRPSHFLRKAIAQKIKGSFIPPVIFSMDDFVDFIYESGERELAGGDRKIETIDAIAILYDIHRKALHPLGGDSFQTPDSFFPIGLKIYRDLEELFIEGVKPAMIKQIEPYTTEAIPEHALKGLQSLSFFYEQFYAAIEEKGLSTRSLRYRVVSEKNEDAELDSYKQIVFAGFYALTKYEKVLFRKLLEKENTLFIFQEGPGLEEKLSDLGMTSKNPPLPPFDKGGNPLDSSPTSPEIHFYSSPDTHGQVYALSKVISNHPTLIKGGKGGFLDEKTAIVLPVAETLFPLLRQGLSFLDEAGYNISLGYPLHRTPVFGFLNSLMELITSMDDDRIYIPDYLKFVLHPYTKNIYHNGSAEITRITFHAIEEKLTESRTRTFATLQELEEDANLLNYVLEKAPKDEKGITKSAIKGHLKAVHLNTIEKFLSFENIRDFAEKCTGLLTYIFHNSTARLHPLFYPFSESFLRELEVISKSLLRDFAFNETVSYFTFFRKYIMTAYSPFEGAPLKGLQLLGFLETRNIRFDEVYILDANEEAIPATRKDDSILPFRARQILGIPTYIDRDKLAAYYFEILVKGAAKAHIFFIENDKKERSRFVEKLLWEKQKQDRSTDTKNYIQPVQYKVNLDNPVPADIVKTAGVTDYLKHFEYHATALDRYLACRLQFYYTYVLGLGKKEEVSGDIERIDIGKFVHKALAEYFKKRNGLQLKEADLNVEELSLLADKLFEEQYGKDPSGAAYLLKVQIKNRLKDILRKYYIPLIMEEQVAILGTESRMAISEGPFHLKGFIDSIEKRGNKICIIDYKTGATSNRLKINFNKLDPDDRDSWDEAIGSLQLPFYLLLYSGKTGAKIRDLNAMFLLLGQSGISPKIEAPLFETGDEERRYGVLKNIIRRLLEEIVDPAQTFRAASDKKASCPDCGFKYICGTQWVVK